MFRFTIRDLLWLMVVVGMALGWWIHSARLKRRLYDVAYGRGEAVARLYSVEKNRDFFNELNAEQIEELERENTQLREEIQSLKAQPSPKKASPVDN